MYCTSKGKVKYYETGWIVLELVLDRHSVERVVRAYTAARTERSMLVMRSITQEERMRLTVELIDSTRARSELTGVKYSL